MNMTYLTRCTMISTSWESAVDSHLLKSFSPALVGNGHDIMLGIESGQQIVSIERLIYFSQFLYHFIFHIIFMSFDDPPFAPTASSTPMDHPTQSPNNSSLLNLWRHD